MSGKLRREVSEVGLGWPSKQTPRQRANAPGPEAKEQALTQPQDRHLQDDGLLGFIADPTMRDDAEQLGFGHDGIEDVMPSADGRAVTVLFGDGTAKTYEPDES